MSLWKKNQDVFIQDQTSPPFQYYLMREDKADITLTSAINPLDSIINVSSGHGFTAGGEWISIFDNNRFLQTKVKSVLSDSITLDNPSNYSFSTNSIVIRGIVEMNQNASITPQEFIYYPRRSLVPIDIICTLVIINHSAESDYSKFGSITALTNGVSFKRQNSLYQNLGVFRSNSSFTEYGANVEFSDKAGGGAYSTIAKFFIKDIYGIGIRINPREGDIFKGIIQDDLSALLKFRIALTGHYTEGE